jgi:type IV secretory pathway VirB10-like protein
MFSKPVAFAILALGCVTAAAGGAFVATRRNAADITASAPRGSAAPVAVVSQPAAQPVTETEATVAAEKPAPEPLTAESPAATASDEAKSSAAEPTKRTTPEKTKPSRSESPTTARTVPSRDGGSTAPSQETTPGAGSPTATTPPTSIDPPRPIEPQPEPVRAPQFEEVVLPAASVIGLQVETALSSERARIEDRVEARVTRDVMANRRVAIPAGSRVIGSVTLVDKGGKLKERARLGIRFHTVVLADGSEVPLNTEPFYRDGESPAPDSAKKIGGAAAVGAILGGILGGGKGAVIGGTTGAAGGTAAAMAGDRNPATVASGSIVTVRLSAPVTIQVEKREQ